MLAAKTGASWLHVNGNWARHLYSTLNQVNASNAGDFKSGVDILHRRQDGRAVTPIYYDGLLYFAQDNTVFAVDTGAGRQVWKYAHELPEDFGGYNVPFFTGKHRGSRYRHRAGALALRSGSRRPVGLRRAADAFHHHPQWPQDDRAAYGPLNGYVYLPAIKMGMAYVRGEQGYQQRAPLRRL